MSKQVKKKTSNVIVTEIKAKVLSTRAILVIGNDIIEVNYTKDNNEGNNNRDIISSIIKEYNNAISAVKRKKAKKKIMDFIDSMLPILESTPEADKVIEDEIALDIKNIGNTYSQLKYDKKIGVYLKNIKIALPVDLSKKIVELYNTGETLQAYINFWSLLLLNPNSNSRISFYKYVKNNPDFIITEGGYVLTFRRVKKKREQTNPYPEYIAEQYMKCKAQKKSPSKYILMADQSNFEETIRLHNINQDENKWIEKGYEILLNGGLLSELNTKYEKASGKTIYTCARTIDATHGTTIIIGEPVSMPRELCDEDVNNPCSKGLHVGSLGWVGTGYNDGPNNHNAGFGDNLIACLINPRDVVAVPYRDEYKMRVCKYFPFAVVTGKTAYEVKQMNLNKFESDYKDIEESDINDLLKNYKSYKKDKEINIDLNLTHIKEIVKLRID